MKEIKKITLSVSGMFCSSCSSIIEFFIGRIHGIQRVSVDYFNEMLKAEFDPEATSEEEIIRWLRHYGYGVKTSASKVHAGSAAVMPVHGRHRSFNRIHHVLWDSFRLIHPRNRFSFLLIFSLLLTIPIVVYSMLHDFGVVDLDHDRLILLVMASLVQFVGGWSFYAGSFRSIKAGRANMDVLIAIGSTVAYCSSVAVTLGWIGSKDVYFETAASVITLILLGRYLESRAKDRSAAAIRDLESLRPDVARVIRNGIESEVDASSLKPGDVVIVGPGGRFPADGIVLSGCSSVDESAISGESVPLTKEKGDAITGATLNNEGWITFEVTRAGAECTHSRILRLVEEALSTKAPIQKLADEIGRYFVPIVIALSLMTYAGWILVAHQDWSVGMINAIAVLVIACPCAIGLATPAALLSGTAMGASCGILFRNGTVLEKAGQVSCVVLDKTGTITTGKPEVKKVLGFGGATVSEVIRTAALAESGSEHPLGKAILREAEKTGKPASGIAEYSLFPGSGISALEKDRIILVGNERLMKSEGVPYEASLPDCRILEAGGFTVVFVCEKPNKAEETYQLKGLIALADTVKPTAAEAVGQLKKMGIDVVLMSGDNRQATAMIARQAGIDRFFSDISPEGKMEEIKNLQQGFSGGTMRPVIAMVGDGINDAPALAAADIGIAMGTGTDLAVSTAGITLVSGDPEGVVKAIQLSRKTRQTIIQNLTWALFYNIALIPVAAYGLLSPMIAAGAMVFSSLFVMSNSLRMRNHVRVEGKGSSSFLREFMEMTPRILAPAAALAVLIILPMYAMPGNTEIKGVLPTSMTPALMMIMALANGLIAISYASIPVFLVVFVRKRTDLPFSWAVTLFGAFILVCGTTHFVHIIGLWRNVDWWQAGIDSACALISMATAVVVWPILPKLLAIPSPDQLRQMNQELQIEKSKLEAARDELRKAYAVVEQRVEERTAELKASEEEVRKLNSDLEQRVSERTAQLEISNRELEAFSYSVSHDLRAPLRSIDGWSVALYEDCYDLLDDKGKKYIDRVRSEAQRMGQLIDGLLQLSRVSRVEMKNVEVDLSQLTGCICSRLSEANKARQLIFHIAENVIVIGDPLTLEVLMTNLLDNAVKFTSKAETAIVEFGVAQIDGIPTCFVKDNGVGFDMAYAGNLFGAFQRMHKQTEFPGTGIGLATVQRVVHRHGGRIWADSSPGKGTTFYFTLRKE